MLTPMDIGIIAGGLIAFVFFLIGMKDRNATRNGSIIFAKREGPLAVTRKAKGCLAEMGRLVIAPSGDGLSFRRSIYEEPQVIIYGKEFADDSFYPERMAGLPPVMATVVRVDDHALEFSYRDNGELVFQCIYAVSPNGKQLKAIGLYSGRSANSTIYKRIGSIPDGDAFFGTWQRPWPNLKESLQAYYNRLKSTTTQVAKSDQNSGAP